MTRIQIIQKMLTKEPNKLFRTMELGGSVRPLLKLQDEGLISSQRRYRSRSPQRDWFATEEQQVILRDEINSLAARASRGSAALERSRP